MSFGERLALVVVGSIAAGVLALVAMHTGLALATGAAAFAVAAGRQARRWREAFAWVALAGLSAAYGAHTRDAALTDRQPPAELSIIEGTLRRDAALGDSGVRLDVQLQDARVLINVSGDLAASRMHAWTAGRRVRMPARMRLPSVTRNPGSPSVRWQQLTRPVDFVGTVKSGTLVDAAPAAAWQEAAAAVRRYVRAVASRWLEPLDPQTAAVVTAILIGDRAGLDEKVIRRLQVAGTFHVIAISGGNVAMLTALCLFLCRAVVRGDRGPVLLTLGVVVSYGVVVGDDASVTRAVVAASLYLGLRLIGLVPRAINVLAMTGVLCVLADPLVVVDVGAWLSFGATFGLITVLPRLLPPAGTHRPSIWRLCRGLFLATAAAEIVILPITASVFMRVGVAGLLLNFVAIPAMTLIQLSGLLLCAVAWWWPGAASVVALTAHGATGALVGSASVVDLAPWLAWRVPPPPLGWTLAYYALVGAAMWWRGRRAVTRAAVALAAGCACVIVLSPGTPRRRPPAGWLRVTMVDVGQGEAIVVQAPDGKVLLVDAGGSAGRFDVGGRVVTPALWALGVRRLDWLAVTHGDIDHVGGAGRVTQDLRPREIWEGVPVPLHPPLVALRRAAQDRGLTWRRLQAGHQLELGGVAIDVVHPPLPDWERPRVRNDDSLVLRVRFGRVEVLLTGDVGPEFESAFGLDVAPPPIRLLKLAHHGSRTSSSESFLDAYGPAAALVSAGQDNLFGHPSPVVLARLRQRGVTVFRTDRDGAIVIETDGREARVRTWTGRTLLVRAAASRVATPPPFPR
jgi:competence protein ComEC